MQRRPIVVDTQVFFALTLVMYYGLPQTERRYLWLKYIIGLVQDCSISIVLTLEIL